MKLNIILLLIVGVSTFGLTLLLTNNNVVKTINEIPNKEAIKKEIKNKEAIPAFTFTDINKTTKNSADFKDKIIILNFWASWCAPCIKEFPNLLKAANNNPEDIILIALSSDLEESAINRFIKKAQQNENFDTLSFNGPNIHIALDIDQAITAGKFSTFKLPETLIIDQQQKLQHKLIGANWTLNDLQAIIDKLKQKT
ncbi:MAG: TlpA family protein disulfide reductase [Bdellovibrionales bacterium]